jgi:uncharacterized protein YkuJ
MDKSFNDQELSDIMKEIEALEEDFSDEPSEEESESETETESSVVEVASHHDEPVVTHHEEEEQETAFDQVDEVIQELAEMEEEEAIPVPAAKSEKVVAFPEKPVKHTSHPSHHNHQPTGTCMSMKVHGDLKLELHFEVAGKSVTLDVSDHGLSIEMDGGISFTVPLSGKKAS